MKRFYTFALLLCLAFVACDRTDDSTSEQPDAPEMPAALIDTWTVYEMTMAVGNTENTLPAELFDEPYYFSFYDNDLATMSTYDYYGQYFTLYSFRCSQYGHYTMVMTLSAEGVIFDCDFDVIDDNHLELYMHNTNITQDDVPPGDFVVSYYRYKLIRGRHSDITFAEAATPEQIAARELPEPSPTDPLVGTSWQYVAVSMHSADGEVVRNNIDTQIIDWKISFDENGGFLSLRSGYDNSEPEAYNDTYVYNPTTGCLEMGEGGFFGGGLTRVCRDGDELRLVDVYDDGYYAYHFALIE